MSEGSQAPVCPGAPVICIVGPTASGKSALADEVAVRLGTDVISVDSMQVYRGMDIGTAKTPMGERRVPLQMVDVSDISKDYSVAMFQRDARILVNERRCAGKAAILCGGTGLYLDGVIDVMEFPTGETHGEVRSKYEGYLAKHGTHALWELLDSRDHESAAAIHPNNARRVVRALEMHDEGTSYAEQLSGLKARRPYYSVEMWGITMDRQRLYRRIDERVDAMMVAGLVDEVEGLVSAGLGEDLTARQAIGYKEVLAYLGGSCSLDECVELIKRRSRRYAKRQLSWLRRDGRVRWLDMDVLDTSGAADLVVKSYSAALRSS